MRCYSAIKLPGFGLGFALVGFLLFTGLQITQGTKIDDALYEAKKLGLNSDEFDSFELTKLLTSINGQIKPFNHKEIKQRRRRGAPDETTLHIPLDDDIYRVNLFHPRQVLHPDARIVLTDGDVQHEVDAVASDCYMVGDVASHGGTASFSYCHGLRGAFHTSGQEIVLLPVNKDEHLVAIRKNQPKENVQYEFDNRDDFEDDTILNSEEESQRSEGGTEANDSAPPKPIDTTGKAVIEIGVYIDADYNKYLENVGEKTLEKKIDFILVKWNAVQYEYSKKEQLGREVEIHLKKMEFWKTNPNWLKLSNKLGSLLHSICQWNKDKEPFDTIYLHTGHSPISPLGLAYVGGACHSKIRCAVSADKMWGKYVAVAHELGHNLNMKHDGDTPCRTQPKAINGLMGGHGTNFSRCSVEAFKTFIQKKRGNCLFVENVKKTSSVLKGIKLNGLLPQMYHSFDDMCIHHVGPGYRYREFTYHTKYSCANNHFCVNMNPGKSYGHLQNINMKPLGQYCAKGKACYQGHCVPYEDFHLHVKVPIQNGKWSEWSPFSSCSRSCGTGVMISIRKCNSPSSMNSPDCPGNQYRAKLCNLKPCSDDPIPIKNIKSLARKRATEVCKNFIQTGILSSTKFQENGNVFQLQDPLKGCEVFCYPKKGHRHQRLGLMPDGSPCLKPSQDYKFPVNDHKVKYRCLKGVCQVFDCLNEFPASIFGKNPKCLENGQGIIG